jgi:hypothetical protein
MSANIFTVYCGQLEVPIRLKASFIVLQSTQVLGCSFGSFIFTKVVSPLGTGSGYRYSEFVLLDSQCLCRHLGFN